jgi:hypothetical protein
VAAVIAVVACDARAWRDGPGRWVHCGCDRLAFGFLCDKRGLRAGGHVDALHVRVAVADFR